MAKEQRKKRTKVSETEDLLTPFDVTKLGSDEDPCFGKLFDPQNEICKMCGDAEFCSITQMYKLDLKRKIAESEADYKDLHEDEYQKNPLNIVIDRLKRADGKWVKKEALIKTLKTKNFKVKDIKTLETNGFFDKLGFEECIKTNKDKTKYKFI